MSQLQISFDKYNVLNEWKHNLYLDVVVWFGRVHD